VFRGHDAGGSSPPPPAYHSPPLIYIDRGLCSSCSLLVTSVGCSHVHGDDKLPTTVAATAGARRASLRPSFAVGRPPMTWTRTASRARPACPAPVPSRSAVVVSASAAVDVVNRRAPWNDQRTTGRELMAAWRKLRFVGYTSTSKDWTNEAFLPANEPNPLSTHGTLSSSVQR